MLPPRYPKILVVEILHDLFDVVLLFGDHFIYTITEGSLVLIGSLFGTERSLKLFVMKPSVKSLMMTYTGI
jgi:hypothetical protein